MSQIAFFYLLKDGQRQELSGGDCSGAVYMAIWDWCESELDLDVRFPAHQTEDTLDCALLELSLIHISEGNDPRIRQWRASAMLSVPVPPLREAPGLDGF